MQRSVETRPSGANRWTKCSAAPLFASRTPLQPSGDPAREGTCAAWVGELVLNGHALHCRDLIGECEPREHWEVDAEMAGHVQGYVDMIRADGGFISAERFVRLSDKIAGTLDNAGSFLNGVIKVRDLKYGFRTVEADSDQLVIYAGALMWEMQQQGQPVTEVWTEIYQPRAIHHLGIHRKQRWTPEQIAERCRWIIQRAEECHKPNPIATPGGHCIDCDGAPGCEALARTSANLIAMVESEHHAERTPAELAEQLKFIRRSKKIIDAAAQAVESEALARNDRGDRIPGFGKKERTGHRKFLHDREAIKALTGIDPVKEKLMSPAELKAAGATDAQLSILSHKPTIGHKLEELDARDLLREFSKGH